MTISDLDLPKEICTHELTDATRLATQLADDVAGTLSAAIEASGVASLLVSGGRSPIAFFEALSSRPLDWSHVQIGLVDERRVPVDQADSNEALVRQYLLRNQAAAATFVGLYREAPTHEEAARLSGQSINELRRPIDVVVLGMGEDGHTASLFPGNPGLAAALDSQCLDSCVPMRAPVAPYERISLSYPVLASARRRYLAIQGSAKLETLRQALRSDPLQMPIRAFLDQPLEIYWCP
ncbi:6-phosphogluconolactonase [Azomonas macrocytogenes]|uniref:6-phosphogluconolactonase n=1 Tax=Azomonas macrocytogenes TaxID=69962 RepID=A0A839T578_AZOMA|nr:6-phosphogluconolactonase [Azomonas macrocytogenes]MBB3103930.1 6-phosphogluconolactonase [Azomonas macrocytogenes]